MPKPRVLLALLLVLPLWLCAQEYEGKQLVRADLIADTTAVVPGTPFTVALRLAMEPGWHTYWQYAGDAGLPTQLDWTLPEGFVTGPIQWPLPEKLVEPGDLVTFGYGNEVLLLVEITPPARIANTSEVTLKADASWLVCEEICIPGDATDLSLSMPVAASAAAANSTLFAKYRARLPIPECPYTLKWTLGPAEATVEISDVPEDAELDFFPLPGEDMQIGHPTVVHGSEPGTRTITIPLAETPDGEPPIEGVLVRLEPDGQPPEIGWTVSSASRAASIPALTPHALPQPGGFIRFLLLGFVGGLILNVMPCVLPVITLKLLGFIKQAGESPKKIFRLGLTFVAGIFAWFIVMATLASILRATGSQLNWAFQFQSPYYLIGIAAVLFVFGLNLMGVFEIVLPGSANSRFLDLASREGYLGAFLHGIFATLLATPCLAPYLGTAVGFAVAQPPIVIFAVFMAIAAGMSLPYVILTIRPRWMRFLPRPGIWMERVKQGMGFLLMATVLLVLWVLGRQRGADGVLWVCGFLLSLAIAAWIFGAFAGPMASRRSRWLARLSMLVVAGGGLHYFINTQFAATPPVTVRNAPSKDGIAWEEFSPEALAQVVHSGRTVFLDFTADWCLNCKTNERLILESDAVRDAFARNDVVPMKADWTNGDPEITKMLRSFGRAGVPTYAVYREGSATPELLPELLTKALVIEAVTTPPSNH